MTHRAGISVARLPAYRIGRAIELRHLARAQAGQQLTRRHAGRQKFDVRHHCLHFRRADGQRPPIHAAGHAGIETILDCHLRPRTGAVARKFAEQPEQRDTEFLGPCLKVTVAACEIVSGKAL